MSGLADCCIVCLEDVTPDMVMVNCHQCTGQWCVACHAQLIREKCPQCRASLREHSSRQTGISSLVKRPRLATPVIVVPARRQIFVVHDAALRQILHKVLYGQRGATIDLLLRRRILAKETNSGQTLLAGPIIKVLACYTGLDGQKHRCTIRHANGARYISVAVTEQLFRSCVVRSYADETNVNPGQLWFSMETRYINVDADLPDTTSIFPKHALTMAWISPAPLFPKFGSLHLGWRTLDDAEWPAVHIKLHCRPRSQTKPGTACFEKKACVSFGNGT